MMRATKSGFPNPLKRVDRHTKTSLQFKYRLYDPAK